jgi:hypothetical protein
LAGTGVREELPEKIINFAKTLADSIKDSAVH